MESNVHAMLRANLENVRRRMAEACDRAGRRTDSVTLIAVTKTVDADVARSLYDLGVRDFAENRPQALWEKADKLPYDVRWHLIGRLQTNKVRRTISKTALIHSVDRMKLALELSSEAIKASRRLDVCLEINITGETSKQGFSPSEARDAFAELDGLSSLKIVGLMTMARYEDEPEQCRSTFTALRAFADELSRIRTFDRPLSMLSMGMSNDFEVAIEEGATHVRVGSALFEGLS